MCIRDRCVCVCVCVYVCVCVCAIYSFHLYILKIHITHILSSFLHLLTFILVFLLIFHFLHNSSRIFFGLYILLTTNLYYPLEYSQYHFIFSSEAHCHLILQWIIVWFYILSGNIVCKLCSCIERCDVLWALGIAETGFFNVWRYRWCTQGR